MGKKKTARLITKSDIDKVLRGAQPRNQRPCQSEWVNMLTCMAKHNVENFHSTECGKEYVGLVTCQREGMSWKSKRMRATQNHSVIFQLPRLNKQLHK
jgi:hypothetical protein